MEFVLHFNVVYSSFFQHFASVWVWKCCGWFRLLLVDIRPTGNIRSVTPPPTNHHVALLPESAAHLGSRPQVPCWLMGWSSAHRWLTIKPRRDNVEERLTCAQVQTQTGSSVGGWSVKINSEDGKHKNEWRRIRQNSARRWQNTDSRSFFILI